MIEKDSDLGRRQGRDHRGSQSIGGTQWSYYWIVFVRKKGSVVLKFVSTDPSLFDDEAQSLIRSTMMMLGRGHGSRKPEHVPTFTVDEAGASVELDARSLAEASDFMAVVYRHAHMHEGIPTPSLFFEGMEAEDFILSHFQVLERALREGAARMAAREAHARAEKAAGIRPAVGSDPWP